MTRPNTVVVLIGRMWRRAIVSIITATVIVVLDAPLAAKILELAEPTEVGFSKTGIDELESRFKSMVDGGRRAGIAWGVARNGKLLAYGAYGHRSIEKNLPMETNTVFRLYSQTRAVTAAAILTLVDEGKLSLQDPVSQYIPAFGDTPVIKAIVSDKIIMEPQTPTMNVFHLFTYTSGLGYARDWPDIIGIKQRDILGLDQTTEEGINKLASFPLLMQPGKRWYYGFSSDVLGRIAEVISGQPLNEFLENSLLRPLGMNDTGFWIQNGDADLLADVYGRGEKGTLINRTTTTPPSGPYTERGTFFSAGGGLVSTVMDYLRFQQMLLGGGKLEGVRILKEETVKSMITNQLTPDQMPLFWYDTRPSPVLKTYGWGLAVGVRPSGTHKTSGNVGEVRWGGLANTTFFIDPKTGIIATAMSQYLGPDSDELVINLAEGVYAALLD